MNKSAVFAVLASATLLAGCATTVPGDPSGTSPVASASPTATTTTAAPSPITVPAGLDTGAFPTKPRTITVSANRAWVAEGNRMGDALIQANEVDPRLIIGGAGLRSYPVLMGDGLNSRVPDATATAFQRAHMRVGMTTTRGDRLKDPTVAVRIGLYRFDTDDAAKQALGDIQVIARAKPAVQITVPGADVLASEFKPGTVDAYVAQGPFVINVSGTGPTTSAGADFVTKAFTLELAKLKDFTPTPVDKVTTLNIDEDGMLSRTLPSATSGDPTMFENWYDFTGLLHRIQDISNTATFRAAGIDLIGDAGSIVYRTKDAAAATTMVETVAGKNPAAPGIAQLPSVKCMTGGQYTYCWVPVGRHVASVYDANAAVARQKAAAQYSILAAAN